MGKTRAIRRERSDGVELGYGVVAADVEAVARRVVELLSDGLIVAPASPDLVDAAELARRLGIRRSWVYAHADDLGAIRLGAGPRPRLRFDPSVAMERMQLVAPAPERTPAARCRRQSKARQRDAHLLQIKDGGAN